MGDPTGEISQRHRVKKTYSVAIDGAIFTTP
jgi:hypothetical protein